MKFLIQFFLKNGIHSRRTFWMGMLSLIPLAVAVLLFLLRPLLEREGMSLSALFPQINFALYLHFLLPLLSVFIGAAVIGDELDDRTLPYLLVRPLQRRWIVLSKLIAGWLTAGIMLFVSLVLTYAVMMLGGGAHLGDSFGQLMQSGGILLLGLAVYIPFFALLGGVIKHPVLVGLLLTYGWENSVAFFPGNVKLVTVVHYLHILSPPLQQGSQEGTRGLLSMALPQAKEISDLSALFILLVLSALFAYLASSLLLVKEYRLQQEA